MDIETARSFCERWLAAWTGGAARVDELLAFYSADAFYLDPGRPEGIRGRDELRKYLRKLLARYPSWGWELVEVFATPRGLILKWRATHGKRTCCGLDIVEVKDALIVRNEVYFDPSGLLE